MSQTGGIMNMSDANGMAIQQPQGSSLNHQSTPGAVGQHGAMYPPSHPLNGAQSQQQPQQHHSLNNLNNISQNAFNSNQNMNNPATAAFAAALGQQMLQMGMQSPGQNQAHNMQNANAFVNQDANGSLADQISAFMHQHHQNQVNAQTQSQLAAILAASGLGNNNNNNMYQGQNAQAPMLALSQAFALIQQAMQSQPAQSQMNHQQQISQQFQPEQHIQTISQHQNTPSPSEQVMLHQQFQMQEQPQHALPATSTNPPALAEKQTVVRSPTPATPKKQKTDHKLEKKKAKAPKRQKTGSPKKDVDKNKVDNVANGSNSSNQHVQSGMSSLNNQTLTHASASPFQMPAPTSHSHPSQMLYNPSMSMPQNGHNMIQRSMNPNINPIVLSQMQSWKLDQLEGHVKLLQETGQPIPHAVKILLHEARKTEQKKAAKRIANRKSASTSRARKKALVAEMTKTNSRLRRQAIILSLLPDLVIAIQEDGTITFCSAQVERVLRHKVSDMIGANISQVLTPASHKALFELIEKLISAEKTIAGDDNNNKEGDESGRSSNSGNTLSAAVVSEQSDHFPLSIVKVKSHKHAKGSNDSSDSGNRNNAVTDAAMSRSATQSSLTTTNQSNSNSDNSNGGTASAGSGSNGSNDSRKRKAHRNSDIDSSSSSEPNKIVRNANEALNRNVRFHNEQLKIKEDLEKKRLAHKDDVTGDFVTANNADARLSSLMMTTETTESAPEVKASETPTSPTLEGPRKPDPNPNDENTEDNSSSSSSLSLLAGVEDRHKKRKRTENNASDDSGYRESAESDPSREDSASSTSEASNGRRRKPLAPTCNVCLIRDDLTTIWCEVTSSIRTVSSDDNEQDSVTNTSKSVSLKKKDASSSSSDDQQGSNCSSKEAPMKELLLCLRPTSDGTEKVSEDLRFIPNLKKIPRELESKSDSKQESQDNTSSNGEATASHSTKSGNKNTHMPVKKRALTQDESEAITSEAIRRSSLTDAPCAKKQLVETTEDDAERKTVVESLILMSSN